MKIGYIQTSPIFGEKEKNFEQVTELASKIKVDLLVLPELFATGYNFISKKEAESLSEGLDGQTARFLKKLSKKTSSTIVGGFIEKEKENIFNSAMIISDSELLGVYRKLHLYYKEKLWFTPGDRPLKVYEINGVKIGIMICFDWFFPETTRTLALLGADIIAHPANLVLPYCQKAMITRSLENRVYTITANRIGQEIRGEDNFKFTGESQITSYDGEVLSLAPPDKIFLDFVEIDTDKVRNNKLNEFNDVLKDRRKDFYLI